MILFLEGGKYGSMHKLGGSGDKLPKERFEICNPRDCF